MRKRATIWSRDENGCYYRVWEMAQLFRQGDEIMTETMTETAPVGTPPDMKPPVLVAGYSGYSDEIMAIGDQIATLTVLQAGELADYLETEYRIKAPVSVDIQPRQEPKEPTPQVQVQTEFAVVLESYDEAKRIGVIKEVREVTGLGLKPSMEFVNALPKVVKEALPKADAEKLKAKLESAGGKCSIK